MVRRPGRSGRAERAVEHEVASASDVSYGWRWQRFGERRAIVHRLFSRNSAAMQSPERHGLGTKRDENDEDCYRGDLPQIPARLE